MDDQLRAALDEFNLQCQQAASAAPATRKRTGKAKWPIKSVGLAVHPKEIASAREASIRAGVPTDFTPEGRAIIHSQKHQNQYAASRGMTNLDRYY